MSERVCVEDSAQPCVQWCVREREGLSWVKVFERVMVKAHRQTGEGGGVSECGGRGRWDRFCTPVYRQKRRRVRPFN